MESNVPLPHFKVCPICLTNPKDMAFGCGHLVIIYVYQTQLSFKISIFRCEFSGGFLSSSDCICKYADMQGLWCINNFVPLVPTTYHYSSSTFQLTWSNVRRFPCWRHSSICNYNYNKPCCFGLFLNQMISFIHGFQIIVSENDSVVLSNLYRITCICRFMYFLWF